MKRAILILALGLIAATASFWAASRLHGPRPASTGNSTNAGESTHRHPSSDSQSGLAWLQTEFHLDAEAFQKIQALHQAYRPKCEELCRRIDNHNRRLQAALLEGQSLTEEARRLLEEGARVRSECHAALASHLIEVSRCMPQDQGRRYLELMLPATGITGASHPIIEFTHPRPHE